MNISPRPSSRPWWPARSPSSPACSSWGSSSISSQSRCSRDFPPAQRSISPRASSPSSSESRAWMGTSSNVSGTSSRTSAKRTAGLWRSAFPASWPCLRWSDSSRHCLARSSSCSLRSRLMYVTDLQDKGVTVAGEFPSGLPGLGISQHSDRPHLRHHRPGVRMFSAFICGRDRRCEDLRRAAQAARRCQPGALRERRDQYRLRTCERLSGRRQHVALRGQRRRRRENAAGWRNRRDPARHRLALPYRHLRQAARSDPGRGGVGRGAWPGRYSCLEAHLSPEPRRVRRRHADRRRRADVRHAGRYLDRRGLLAAAAGLPRVPAARRRARARSRHEQTLLRSRVIPTTRRSPARWSYASTAASFTRMPMRSRTAWTNW